jgi:hypothetical protein
MPFIQGLTLNNHILFLVVNSGFDYNSVGYYVSYLAWPREDLNHLQAGHE